MVTMLSTSANVVSSQTAFVGVDKDTRTVLHDVSRSASNEFVSCFLPHCQVTIRWFCRVFFFFLFLLFFFFFFFFFLLNASTGTHTYKGWAGLGQHPKRSCLTLVYICQDTEPVLSRMRQETFCRFRMRRHFCRVLKRQTPAAFQMSAESLVRESKERSVRCGFAAIAIFVVFQLL